MTQRPWPIVLIALFHIIAPIWNFISSAQLIDLSLIDYLNLQLKHGVIYTLIWFLLPFLAGVALLTFRLWSYYAFLVFMVLVAGFTLRQRLLYPHRVSLALFIAYELINVAIILYFLTPTVRRIYLDKRIRWWQQSPRFLINLRAQVKVKNQEWAAEILNISQGGVFIAIPGRIQSNDSITISFEYNGANYQQTGLVVHTSDKGYGVLFNESFAAVSEMKKLIKQLKKDKVPIRGKEKTLFESFRHWLKELLTTGHGIFPNK